MLLLFSEFLHILPSFIRFMKKKIFKNKIKLVLSRFTIGQRVVKLESRFRFNIVKTLIRFLYNLLIRAEGKLSVAAPSEEKLSELNTDEDCLK